MGKNIEETLSQMDAEEISVIVGGMFDNATTTVVEWDCELLKGGYTEGAYRVFGRAQVDGEIRPWSVILKVPSPIASVGGFPEREGTVLADSYVDSIPCRIHTPRCYGFTSGGENLDWIWMEEVEDAERGQWSREILFDAAGALAQFNYASTLQDRWPDWPWIREECQLREFVVRFGVDERELTEALDRWTTRGLDPSFAARMLQLHADRERYLDFLDTLPACISHGDADRRNLLYHPGKSGARSIVAIDWALSGRSVLGDDSQNLVNGSVVWGQFDLDDIEKLDEIAFSGYVAGLRDSGWEGDEGEIRLGHVISSALKWGLTLGSVAATRTFPDPTDEQVHFIHRFLVHTLGHADEGELLLRQLG